MNRRDFLKGGATTSTSVMVALAVGGTGAAEMGNILSFAEQQKDNSSELKTSRNYRENDIITENPYSVTKTQVGLGNQHHV